jgi:polyhydroxybutyrate depolymerase
MDATVPYNGGMPGAHLWPSAMADHEQWRTLDQCTGTPTTSRGVCQTYSQCAGGVEVTMCSVVGGHVLYGPAAAANVAVPTVAWEIFQRHAGM